MGQAHLHPNVFIVAAGNLQTDRAIVNNLSTAMQSRLVHIQMEVSHKEFMDHAVQAEFDSRVLAFLEFRPGLLHKFDPDHTDRTFPCPRTWEFVSRLVQNKDSDEVNVKLIAGTVGEGAAIEFHTFLDVYKDLPTYRQICDRAETLPVPNGPGSLYATVLMMVDKFTEKSFEDVLPFVERLPAEFRVIYSRGIKRRNPAFIRNPAYIALTRKLVRYLTDDEIPGQDVA